MSGLTKAEREALANEVLGGAEPSPLMVRAVEAILTARQAAVEALLDDLDRGNGLSHGGVSCGVCQGHSPSWDHHSRNCLNALPGRIRATFAAINAALALASQPDGGGR